MSDGGSGEVASAGNLHGSLRALWAVHSCQEASAMAAAVALSLHACACVCVTVQRHLMLFVSSQPLQPADEDRAAELRD